MILDQIGWIYGIAEGKASPAELEATRLVWFAAAGHARDLKNQDIVPKLVHTLITGYR